MKTLTLRLSESDHSDLRHQAAIRSQSVHSLILFKLFGLRDIRPVSVGSRLAVKPPLASPDPDGIDFDDEPDEDVE